MSATEYLVIGLSIVVLLAVLIAVTWRQRKAEKRFIIDRCTSDIRTAGSRPSLTLASR